MINRPDLLILDEPTIGIDAETQAGFFELITHMHAHHHMTFLMVTHDLDMVKVHQHSGCPEGSALGALPGREGLGGWTT